MPSDVRRLIDQGAPATLAISDSSQLLPAVLPEVTDVLPADALEDNEERADSRTTNSWLLRLDDVSAREMLEVQLVNSVAPFLLNSRLKTLLVRSPFARRFIVNVSAVEGQFSRHKTVFHPHTNMAKAALNMMTRTSGEDFARDGIYMNSVDTGWVTDENPTPKRMRIQEEGGFFPPLDIVDGMARIYHPIAQGVTREEEPLFGLVPQRLRPVSRGNRSVSGRCNNRARSGKRLPASEGRPALPMPVPMNGPQACEDRHAPVALSLGEESVSGLWRSMAASGRHERSSPYDR